MQFLLKSRGNWNLVRRWARIFASVAALTLCPGVPAARASMITFATPNGAMAGGNPVSVTATVTTSAGQVTITVTDLQRNPTSDIQTLNGISFSLSTSQTAVSSFTEQAVQRTVISNATFANGGYTNTGTATTFINSPDKWNYNAAGLGVEITSIGNTGGHGTLIGGPNGSNAYAAANGSIKSSNHNPFIAGTATFVLNMVGVNSNSTITGLRFEFGTATGTNVTGVQVITSGTPEPASLTLFGIGAVGMACGACRRRRQQPPAA